MQEEKLEDNDTLEKTDDGNIKIPELSKDKADFIFTKLQGIVFKIGDGFFKINYSNRGQKRFSAELINDIVN